MGSTRLDLTPAHSTGTSGPLTWRGRCTAPWSSGCSSSSPSSSASSTGSASTNLPSPSFHTHTPLLPLLHILPHYLRTMHTMTIPNPEECFQSRTDNHQ